MVDFLIGEIAFSFCFTSTLGHYSLKTTLNLYKFTIKNPPEVSGLSCLTHQV